MRHITSINFSKVNPTQNKVLKWKILLGIQVTEQTLKATGLNSYKLIASLYLDDMS